MKQFQIRYRNSADFAVQAAGLRRTCDTENLSNILFYINWSKDVNGDLDDAVAQIESLFPAAIHYGNEATGNISEGELAYGINVTCYAFEGKDVRTELVWVEKGTAFSSLEDLWSYCRKKDGLKAVELIPSMSYLETLKIDDNVPGLDDSILIFGGASVNYDNDTFDADVIAKGHPRTKDGMAVILYYGQDFQFETSFVLGWKGLGKQMEVTESEGKCIKKIDGKPAYSVYEKYLNLSVEDNDTLVFPLIMQEDGEDFIRTPQIVNSDKSMLMFANTPQGSHVRIAYGDKNTILDTLHRKAEEIAEFRPEAIKAFSCAGRKMFWGDEEISKETRMLEEVAPVCGFYTGGEILKFGNRLKVCNQTLCIIGLKEKSSAAAKTISLLKGNSPDKSLVSRLAYFVEKVSEEQQIEHMKLEEALSAAQLANQAKTTFLSNMSHDIRTPINAITGFTAMAMKYAGNRDIVLDYLDKIDVSSQQLLMLINQVLEMSRIEAGRIEFNEHPVNINERFNIMVTLLSEQAQEHGLEFHYSMQDIRHYNVFADDVRMSQITLNVAGNAMKYTPEGGRVDFILKEIPSRKPGYGTYVFSVEDTGIGMSEEYMKVLFEPFTREKTSTVSRIQGSGLGLSIVKSLVDLCGGDIEVKSKTGEGSKFDITMDLRINEVAQETVVPEKEIPAFTFRGKRALLVEDNELNREIAKFILEDKGIEIDEAEDGDIAVDMIREINDKYYYDFILMDVQMPVMNGYEATAGIREILDPLGIHIPIIAVSANAFEEDRLKSRIAGMDGHIAKPIDVHELWNTLAKFVK